MSTEKDALKQNIIEFLNNRWKDVKEPFLLSKIPSILNNKDYKSVLGGQSLKDFINETSGEDGYEIVEDPRHKAKVAIIPFGENDVYSKNTNSKEIKSGSNNKDILVDFLRMLSSLPDEDLNSIVIPARVLAKLVRQ